jgi:hypothetical protein
MSDLRTAVQQALEALGKWSSGRDMDAVELNDLIATLEAALEQPEQVDVLAEYTGDGTHRQWVSTGAWLMPGERVLHTGADHPPRREWRGLTDAQIAEINMDCALVTPSDIYFARAIEAALKERNA